MFIPSILLATLVGFISQTTEAVKMTVVEGSEWANLSVRITPVSMQTPGQAGKRGRVTCYFTNWAVYREGNTSYSVNDIPYEKCTHLVYAFVGLSNTTWELKVLDPELDIQNGNFLKYLALREKNPNLSLGIAVGGWSEGGLKYSQMANDPRKRCNFTRSVTDFMIRYNFDSFDLDWEYPEFFIIGKPLEENGDQNRGGLPSDKLAVLQLVRELRISFDMYNPNWEITMAVPVAEITVNSGYYVSDLCSVLSAVHLMTYDLRTVGSVGHHNFTTADSHTPLYRRKHDKGILKKLNVHDGVNLWVNKGCAKDKIVVGTAFYGRSFNLTNPELTTPGYAPIDPDFGGGEPAEYTQEAGYIAYFEICERLRRNGTSNTWTRGYDEEGKVPYTFLGRNWIGYEDADSLKIKMDWITNEGFAGAMNWAIDLDDWRGACGKKDVLIDVLNDAMENYTVPESPPVKQVMKENRPPLASEKDMTIFCWNPKRKVVIQGVSSIEMRLEPETKMDAK